MHIRGPACIHSYRRMEALKKTWTQYSEIYGKLNGSQRFTLTLAVVAVLGALLYWGFAGSSSAHLAIYHGKNFSADEMTNAQTVLREAGLTEFKQDGGQLLVPRGQVDRYEAALLAGGGLPDDWGSELEKQFEKQGFFPSDRQSRVRREIALGKDLRRILRAIPEISDAKVIWARQEPRRFSSRAGKVTATVNIKPKPGRELSTRLIRSLRDSVSKMISGLKPEDVTILNLKTGESYNSVRDSSDSIRRLESKKQRQDEYKQRIEQLLSFIPDVLVSVEVKLDDLEAHSQSTVSHDGVAGKTMERRKKVSSDSNVEPIRAEPGVRSNAGGSLQTRAFPKRKSSSSNSDTITESVPAYKATNKVFVPGSPTGTFVSVAVPEAYFKKVAETQSGGSAATPGAAGGGRQKIMDEIKKMVAQAIGEKPDGEAVVVSAYTPSDREVPEFETPFSETAMTLLSRWGGPVGLGMFALLALVMVKRSMPSLPEIETSPLPAIPEPTPENETVAAAEEEVPAAPSPRDKLQTLVRDNPDMTAAVLSDWLAAAE